MSLIRMSVSGAVMILVIVVIRALLLHKLPKRAFLFLWGVVLVRLLIPYTLPCSFSAYSLLPEIGVTEISETVGNITPTPADDPTFLPVTDITPGDPAPLQPDLSPDSAINVINAITPAPDISPENGLPFDIGLAVWIAGMAACTVFFTVSYIKCRIRFRESLPVKSPRIAEWLSEHKLRRRISVRRSDRIAAPLTYGVFRPVILLPKNYEKTDPDDLKFVLAHEYVHIRRFDAVFKILLTAAACVHWFNPLVWAMYIIANKDIEISCDEAVITMLGETEKRNYAMTLIRMEEIKSGFTPLISSFGNNAIKERIVTIMKFKKTTALTAAAAAFLAIGITTAFATSAKVPDNAPASDTVTTPVNNTVSAPASDTTSNTVSAPTNTSTNGIINAPAANTPNDTVSTPVNDSASVPANSAAPENDPVEATPGKTLRPTTAAKYTTDYYLEKYADYLVDTPPDGGYFILIDSDENGKQVLRYLSFDCVPEDDFYQEPDNYTNEQVVDGGIIRWNSNCQSSENCPNYQSGSCGTVCRDRDCPTHGYNYSQQSGAQQSGTQQYGAHHYESHHYESHHSGSHHYESHH